MAHGIGGSESEEKVNTPWSADGRIAHTARGNVFNTIRIPFGRSIKITGHNSNNGTYWYIARGVLNYPLIVGDIQLPSIARLKLHKLEDLTTKPLDWVAILNISSQTAGALYMVTMKAVSRAGCCLPGGLGEAETLNYLEGCFRTYTDGSKSAQFLSSGA